jgi:hypothetical protein
MIPEWEADRKKRKAAVEKWRRGWKPFTRQMPAT